MKSSYLLYKSALMCIFILVCIFLFPVIVRAQANINPPGDQLSDATEDIDIRIEDLHATLNSQTRAIDVTFTIANYSPLFISQLESNISAYKGDRLSTNGPLLSGTKFGFDGTSRVRDMYPGERREEYVSIKIPNTIDSGLYFIYTQVQTIDGDLGISWIQETPIYISGLGGGEALPFLSVIYQNRTYTLMEGFQQQVGESFNIGFDQVNSSRKILDALKNGSLYAEYTIQPVQPRDGFTPITGTTTFLYSKSKQGTSTASINHSQTLIPGTYDVYINIYNAKTKLNTGPIRARWLIDGFVSRLSEVRSNSNYIEKSKPIDIEVDVYTKNGIGKKGQLTVELLGAEADIIDVLQKEIDFSLEEQTISFLDKVFAVEDIHKSIKIIKVQLRDAIGNMVDQVELDVQSETPIIAPEIQGSLDKGLYKYIVYGIVILLVLSLTVYAIVNKKKSVAIGLWIVIGVWGSSVLIQNSLYPNVLNAETVSKKTKTHLIVEKSVAAINGLPRKRDRFMGVEGNLGTCPQTATVAFAAWHSCPHCANGIRLELQVDQKTDIVRQQINSQGQVVTQVVSNISRPVFFDTIQFPGGMINNFGTPIFAKTFQLTSEDNMLKYRVVANSVRTSPPHGYCLASGKSSPEYTISCTPSSSVLPLTPMVISGIQAPNCLATHTINWTPLNTGEVEYDIYRSLEVDSNYIKIGSTPVVPGQSTYSFEDVDSPIGTFFYRIQPVGGSNTLMSNSISMTKPLTCNNCQLNPSAPGCNTCTAGQIYCNALDECVTDIEACPNMCGNPDVQVGIGLALDTPNLCTAGFTPESPVTGSAYTNSWSWNCVNVTQSTRTSCSKACPIGTIISNTNLGQTMCVEPITDICPNIPGDQVNNVYRRYENGDCILPLGTIDYFRLTPDTSDLECPAYWTTSIEDGAYMTCTLNGQSVANQNPVGGTPVNVQTGKRHDLQCNVYITEGDVLTGTVISNARCFRKTNVIER